MKRFVNKVLGYLGLILLRKRTVEEIISQNNIGNSQLTEPNMHADLNRAKAEIRQELIKHQIASKWSLVDFMMRGLNTHDIGFQCPLCQYQADSNAFQVYVTQCIFGGGLLERHQCPKCDLIFGAEKMFQLTEGELSQDYEWHYSVYEEGDSTEAEIRAFEALNPSKDGVYLNYGAGTWSKSIKQLREQGWNVFGYEPHSSATGANCENYIIREKHKLDSMQFDGIFSNNVLEHLRYPEVELNNMSSLLKTGAIMAHATPCFEYMYEYTRFHLFFYLGRSRKLMVEKAGLSIERYITDGEFMCCVMRK